MFGTPTERNEPTKPKPALADLEKAEAQARKIAEQAARALETTRAEQTAKVEAARKRFNTDGTDAAADEVVTAERRAQLFIGRTESALKDAQAAHAKASDAIRLHKLAELEHAADQQVLAERLRKLWEAQGAPAVQALVRFARAVEDAIEEAHQAAMAADKLRLPSERRGAERVGFEVQGLRSMLSVVRVKLKEALGSERDRVERLFA